MKNIELTEEHKVKLLEMCKKLFPEYNYNKETGYGGWSIGENYSHSHLIGYLKNDFNDSVDDPDVYIHWFEFCTTHLADKIYELDDDSGNYSDYLEDILHNHPVNYLYEEFKKLK